MRGPYYRRETNLFKLDFDLEEPKNSHLMQALNNSLLTPLIDDRQNNLLPVHHLLMYCSLYSVLSTAI